MNDFFCSTFLILSAATNSSIEDTLIYERELAEKRARFREDVAALFNVAALNLSHYFD